MTLVIIYPALYVLELQIYIIGQMIDLQLDYLVNQTADGEWKAFCNFDNYDAWSRKELMLEPTVCLQALNDQIIYPDEAKLKRPQVGNENL